jgi:hypothetical protein
MGYPREPRKTPLSQMAEIGRLTPERSIRSTRERKPAAPIADFSFPNRKITLDLEECVQITFVQLLNDSE